MSVYERKWFNPLKYFFHGWNYISSSSIYEQGTNKIRISKKTRKKIRAGDEESNNLISRDYHKFNYSIIVSGGMKA